MRIEMFFIKIGVLKKFSTKQSIPAIRINLKKDTNSVKNTIITDIGVIDNLIFYTVI